MAFGLHNGNGLPHALRFIIFLLRLAIGLDFLYLGMGIAFSPSFRDETGARALGDLHLWLASVPNSGSLRMTFAWAFIIIGGALILGLLNRLASIAGVLLVGTSLWPGLSSYTALSVGKFVSDGIIVILCLLIIFLANAGAYLGLDRFIHFGTNKV